MAPRPARATTGAFLLRIQGWAIRPDGGGVGIHHHSGACIIKGIGAIELVGPEHVFEAGAHSKTLVLRDTPEGWKFSVKYVPPIVRERNRK